MQHTRLCGASAKGAAFLKSHQRVSRWCPGGAVHQPLLSLNNTQAFRPIPKPLAWNWEHIVSLAVHPRKRQLSRGHALLGRQQLYLLYQGVVLLMPRASTSACVRRQSCTHHTGLHVQGTSIICLQLHHRDHCVGTIGPHGTCSSQTLQGEPCKLSGCCGGL